MHHTAWLSVKWSFWSSFCWGRHRGFSPAAVPVPLPCSAGLSVFSLHRLLGPRAVLTCLPPRLHPGKGWALWENKSEVPGGSVAAAHLRFVCLIFAFITRGTCGNPHYVRWVLDLGHWKWFSLLFWWSWNEHIEAGDVLTRRVKSCLQILLHIHIPCSIINGKEMMHTSMKEVAVWHDFWQLILQ